jgi:hypothetical protein
MRSPGNGSVPDPDPTARTLEQMQREIAASREIVEAQAKGDRDVTQTRLGGMDKAIELLQKATDKIPEHIKDAVKQLERLHDEKFTSISSEIDTKFAGVGTQFLERDKRTEQLSLADKTAIAAALQAQKESAGAAYENIIAVITKMEASFTKLFDQTQTLLQALARNTDDKINDVKSRLDKGEGKTSVSDPAVTEQMRALTHAVADLSKSRDTGAGQSAGMSTVIAAILGFFVLVSSIASVTAVVVSLTKAAPTANSRPV